MSISVIEAAAVPEELPAASGGRAASRLGQYSWALFEGARNPYVLLITIYIFAPYFSKELVGDPVKGQALWGDLSFYGGIFLAIVAPFLGAIADLGGRRKPWIFAFAFVLATATYALWFSIPGGVEMPLVLTCTCIVVANVAFDLTAVFHNAMLPDICPHSRVGALSGLGLALGNFGGLLILIFMLWSFSLPGNVDWGFVPAQPLFGIDQAAFEDARISAPISAVWLVVFALPLFIFTPDRIRSGMPVGQAIRKGVGGVVKTLLSLRHYRNVATYLLARMFYNDGKTAILTFGGLYAAGTFDWGTIDMLAYGIFLSIFAVFGGIFGGWLDDTFGSRNAILISIGGTSVGLILSLLMGPTSILGIWNFDPAHIPVLYDGPAFNTVPEAIYITIVIIIAIFITAAYANSRTMLARIAPPEKMTEFFGLYAFSGSATAFMAPFVNSRVTTWFHSQAAGMASILLFLGIGLALMLFVKNERAVAVD